MSGDLIQSETPAGFVEVVKIKYGEKIDRPGIYDVPMGWYHDDCCVGPSISSSGLRKIWNHSPSHYWDSSALNKNRAVDDDDFDTEALRIGRAAHTLLLEPHTFTRLFTTRPAMFDSWRGKSAQKWRAEQIAEGFTVLDPPEMLRVYAVRDVLKRHPLYERGILDGDIERSLIWQDKKSGIWLKSRPDAIPRGTNLFTDLKVLRDCRDIPIRNHIFEYGYDMQLALAGVGMWEILKRQIEDFVVVGVESSRPHGVRIAPIGHESIMEALSLLRWAIDKFVSCLEADDWPSFEASDNSYVHRKDFESKRIFEMIKNGELPKEY